MIKSPDLIGAIHCIPNVIRLVDIWAELHWLSEKRANAPVHDAEAFEAITNELDGDLADVDAERWRALCHGTVHTVDGAAALSWCKGAQLHEVWDDWFLSGSTLDERPEFERLAHLLNTALLPRETSLKRMGKVSGSNQL